VRDYRTLTLRLPDDVRALITAVTEVEQHSSTSQMLEVVMTTYVEDYIRHRSPEKFAQVMEVAGSIRSRMQQALLRR
jgi:hypothetical protein